MARLSDDELRALLNLFMSADPWPASDEDRVVIEELLESESKERGYRDWLDAYHCVEG